MLNFVGNSPFSTLSSQQHGFDVAPGPTPGSFIVAMTANGDDGFVHRIVRIYGPTGAPASTALTIDSSEVVGSGVGTIRVKMIDAYRFAVVWYQDSNQSLYAVTSDIDFSFTSTKKLINAPFFTSVEAPGSATDPYPGTFVGYDILSYDFSFAVIWGNANYTTNYGVGATDDSPAYILKFDYVGDIDGVNLPANYLGALNPATYYSYGLFAARGANNGYGVAYNIYNNTTFTDKTFFTAFDVNNVTIGTPVLELPTASTTIKSISAAGAGYRIVRNSTDFNTWYKTYITPSLTLGVTSSKIARSIMNGEYYRIESVYIDPTYFEAVALLDANGDQIDVAYLDPAEATHSANFPVGNSRIVLCSLDPATYVAGVGSGAPASYQAQVSVYDASTAIRRPVFFR